MTSPLSRMLSILLLPLLASAPPPASGAEADAPPVAWDVPWPDASLPHQGYPLLQNTEHVEVYHATPETGMFSHHAHITSSGDSLLAFWSNHGKDEDASGQRILCSVSKDGREWVTPFECFPPMDEMRPAGQAGRVLTANGWLVVDDSAWAVVEVDDKLDRAAPAADPRRSRGKAYKFRGNPPRRGWGRIVRQVRPDGSLGEIFWLVGDPPDPIEGFPSYPDLTDPRFTKVGLAINRALSQAIHLPAWDFRHRTAWIQSADGHGMCEPTVYRRPDGVLVKLSRDLDKSRRIYAFLSHNDGYWWEPGIQTNIPDSPSKAVAGTLPDGRTYLVGNQVAVRGRDPLVLSLSTDGVRFDWAAAIRSGAPPIRMEGRAKSLGFQYPSAVVAKDALWVIYSIGKEDVAVTRISLSELDEK